MTAAPRRTCVVCRTVRDKSALVRLARRPDGQVVADREARMGGRGAYVCDDPRCIAQLGRTGRLTQAFRGPAVVSGEIGIEGIAVTSRR